MVITALAVALLAYCQPALVSSPSTHLVTQSGHSSQVTTITFNADGTLLLTGSLDGTARLWQAGTGVLVRAFTGHTNSIRTAFFCHDGGRIVTASDDGTTRVWETYTGKTLLVLSGEELPRQGTKIFDSKGHPVGMTAGTQRAGFESATFSPDDRRILTASRKNAQLWDSRTGQLLASIKGHQSRVVSAQFDQSGKRIVTASWDKTAIVWDAFNYTRISELKGHSEGLRHASFSPDGRRIVTASDDGSARVWDAASGTQQLNVDTKDGILADATFSPDGLHVVTVSWIGALEKFDAATGQIEGDIKGGGNGFNWAGFSPDGKRLALACGDGSAWICNSENLRLERKITGLATILTKGFFGKWDEFVLTAGWDVSRIWSLGTDKRVLALNGHSDDIRWTSLSPDGRTVATASQDGTAQIWSTSDGRKIASLKGHTKSVYFLQYSSDGRQIATVSEDETMRIWDASDGHVISVLGGLPDYGNVLDFDPKGSYLVTTCANNSACIVETSTGKRLTQLNGHSGKVLDVSYSHDGKTIVTASEDGTARLWDGQNGKLLTVFKNSYLSTETVAALFSPDDKRILTVAAERAILWETASGSKLVELSEDANSITDAAFSSDGSQVLTCSDDGTARTWDVRTGKLKLTLSGNSVGMWDGSFSHDGREILTIARDGIARIWDASTGKELCALLSFEDGSWAVTDPDGRYDASSPDIPGLVWVYSDSAKNFAIPIGSGQLAGRYYTPGLLKKIWNHEPLPDVSGFDSLKPFPEVKSAQLESTTVNASFTDQGGGIGDVVITIGGIEARRLPGKTNLHVDLAEKLKGITNPDVQIYAYDAKGLVHSTPTACTIHGEKGPHDTVDSKLVLKTPKIVAVVGAVQKFASESLGLSFPDEDAVAVAGALINMAQGVGAEIHIELICDSPSAKTFASSHPLQVTSFNADKAGFKAAFEQSSKLADSSDAAYFVYLSGHGAALPINQDKEEFFFLTRDAEDASTASLKDPEIAAKRYVSGDELWSYLAAAKNCKRRVVVIDACHAGALSSNKDDVASLEKKAVREFAAGSGSDVLMGCATDKTSMESPVYRHGVLTYSLLWVLKHEKLDGADGNEIKAATLLERAKDRTSAFAERIHRLQEPSFKGDELGSVVLGRLDEKSRGSIALAERLVLARPVLVGPDGDTSVGDDLVSLLAASESSAKDPNAVDAVAAFLDEAPSSDAYSLHGSYSISEGSVNITAFMYRGKEKCARPFPAVKASRAQIAMELAKALRKWLDGEPKAG